MILNLIYPTESDIKFETINFSDSHPHIKLKPNFELPRAHNITIKMRLDSTNAVFVLRQAVEQLRKINQEVQISLYVAYLLCARYDREMEQYDSFDLKLIADDINRLNLRRVVIAEPHSSMSLGLINDAVAVHPLDKAVADYINDFDDVCMVVPDLGAVKRVEAFLLQEKKDLPVVYVNKHRVMSTGKITGINIMNPQNLTDHVVIYDDLCDGGWTFKVLAKELRERGVKHITLCVTHGIFSKGWLVLLDSANTDGYVDQIITTNSFKDFPEREGIAIHKI